MFVLDTNIVSFFFKQHSLALVYLPMVTNAIQAVSFMTLGELREGALRANWGQNQKRSLEAMIETFVIVNTSSELCDVWAEIRFQRRPKPIAVADAWIAASALSLDCPLVTHNPVDFADTPGLEVLTANISTS